MFRSVTLVALVVVGCSKPEPAPTVAAPSGSAAVAAEAPPALKGLVLRPGQEVVTKQVSPRFTLQGPLTRQIALDAMKVRGFVAEPFTMSKPVAGVSGYRFKGMPAGVAFTERDGRVIAMEAMTEPDTSEKNDAAIIGVAGLVGQIATRQTREDVHEAITQAISGIGKTPGSASCTVGSARLETTRHPNHGYSFKFSAESQAGL